MNAQNQSPLVPLDSNSFHLYDMGEISEIFGVSDRFIQKVRKEGAPFPLGRTRPEWVLDWLKGHADEDGFKGNIAD